MKYTNIKKLDIDNRDYIHITLDNGIKIIYIYHKDLTESIAAATVKVGSYSNPENYLGLAHLLEHMIFMGSKKYNEEGTLIKFASENGGSTNAHTATFETSYYFNSFSDKFNLGVDILIDSLFNPLFKKESFEKEINAVNSEHIKNLDDVDKLEIANNDYLSKKYNVFKFQTGSIATLNKPNIINELKKFHKEYYCTTNITFAFLHNIPFTDFIPINMLNKIKKTVHKEIINNTKITLDGKLLKVSCSKSSLLISFAIPVKEFNELNNYNINIKDYITGNNKGGLKYELIKKKLIKNIYCGHLYVSSKTVILNIYIDTFSNNINYEKIISIINDYIYFLKKNYPPKYINDEECIIKNKLWNENLKYYSLNDIVELTAMHESIDIENYLYINFYSLPWNEKEVKNLWDKLLNDMSINNSLIAISVNNLDNNNKIFIDDYYKINYIIESLPNYSVKHIKFKYKNRNQFIKCFKKNKIAKLENINTKITPIIYDKLNNNKIYYQTSKLYATKYAIILGKNNVGINQLKLSHLTTIVNMAINNLFLKNLKYELQYLNMTIKLNIYNDLILLEIITYNTCIIEIFLKFVEEINKLLQNKKIKQTFNSIYKKWNFNKISPNTKLNMIFYSLITKNNTVEDYTKSRKSINYNDFVNYINNFFNVNYVKLFVYGHSKKDDMNELYSIIMKNVKQNLKYEIEYPKLNNEKESSIKTKFSSTSIIKMLYEINLNTVELSVAYCIIFSNIFDNDFFYNLRTKEQLAYEIYVSYINEGPYENFKFIQGVVFYVKTNVVTTNYLKKRIINFLQNFDIDSIKNNFELIKNNSLTLSNYYAEGTYNKNLRLIMDNINVDYWKKVDKYIKNISFNNLKKIFYDKFLDNPEIRWAKIN